MSWTFFEVILFHILHTRLSRKNIAIGEKGLLSNIKAGSIVIDSSTIDPLTTKELHSEIRSKGAKMIDAPVRS